MENLILGWYVLVESGSVLLLTVFASLQHIGTLLAPMFGVIGDRIGQRNLLCGMRVIYTTLAVTLMTLALTGILTPVYALVIAGIMGLVRPSDLGVRAALIGDTIPAGHLTGAMGIQRTTQDSAKIMGALSGAGLVGLLGMGAAYSVVASLYVVSALLTWKAGSVRPALRRESAAPGTSLRFSPWRELKLGLAYVWNTPRLLAVMTLAFLLNTTAFPLFIALQPYVARYVYGAGQTTLGYMVAGAACGSLLGSIAVSMRGSIRHTARMMVVFCAGWYTMLLIFAQLQDPAFGLPVLFVTGIVHSLGVVLMFAVLLNNSEAQFRGRVMGIRMLAIYGNIPGVLLTGPLIASLGYQVTASLYCVFGLVFTALILLRWRAHLWRG
jgi:MFS family permease